MPLYRYKAITAAGEVVEGEREGADLDRVVALLQENGHVPIRVEPAAGAAQPAPRLALRRGRAKVADLAYATQTLASLLEAGLPLDRALQLVADLTEQPRLRQVWLDVRERVRNGVALSDALKEHPDTFPRIYASTVRAGEAGGALDAVLARLADYLERSRALRESVTSALVYPALLLATAGISVIVLLTWVVPKFRTMFEDLGATLPWPTAAVLAAGDFLRDQGWLLALAVVLGYLIVRLQLARPGGRRWWHGVALRLPLAGGLIARLETARFGRTLGTLVANGVPLLQALGIARDTVGNAALAEDVTTAADRLKEGGRLAEALAQSGRFPSLAVHLIQVGEETGRLDELLLRMADVYDREVRTAVQRLLSLLEPVLIVGLGALIAAIILSILVAILSVNTLVL